MKTASLILNILMLIGLLPAGFMAMMSPMLFDSGATNRTWTIFIVVIALPILIIVSQVFSWINYTRGNYDLAFKIGLIPIVDILILIVLFMISDKLT